MGPIGTLLLENDKKRQCRKPTLVLVSTRRAEAAAPAGGAPRCPEKPIVTAGSLLSSVFEPLTLTDMAAIEELSPSAAPVSARPPEDEIDDDEDEDVSD